MTLRKIEDHPRLRGEHASQKLGGSEEPGSSPPARGALAVVIDRDAAEGIIPACAGSTRRPTRRASPGPDHPRLRGEHRESSTAL